MKKLLIAALALLSIAMVAVGCGGDKKADKVAALKVGATPVPHAEILNFIKPNLEKQGVKMEVIEFSDYVKPNLSLNDKEIDANFFQHDPYLAIFVNDRKLPLASAGKVHIEPMGVYSKNIKDINAVPEGAKLLSPMTPPMVAVHWQSSKALNSSPLNKVLALTQLLLISLITRKNCKLSKSKLLCCRVPWMIPTFP